MCKMLSAFGNLQDQAHAKGVKALMSPNVESVGV